jgi:hypothetical protein
MSPVVVADAADINLDILPTTRLNTTPSLRLEQGWVSNIFNTSSGETSDFYFRAKPELALQWNTPGAGVRLAGSVEETWYYSHPGANEDPTFNVTLGLTGGDAVRITPALTVVPSVYFINTVNSSRRTQLLPSGDPVVPPVTIATYTNTKSNDLGGGLSFSYRATPTMSYGLSGNYGERRFSGDNNSGLTDSRTTGGSLSASYYFTPTFSTGVNVGGAHDTFENNPSSDTMSAGIVFGYQISPVSRLDGGIGMSYARQAQAPGIPEQKSSGPSGRINASFAAESFTANVFASANYSGGSGFGGTTRQRTVGLGITGQFDREWSWNIGGSYQSTRSAFETSAVNLDTTYGNAGLRYQPWEWASMDVLGVFNRQNSSGQFGSSMDNYSAILGITIGTSYNIY